MTKIDTEGGTTFINASVLDEYYNITNELISLKI
jgi:hypothetical protein